MKIYRFFWSPSSARSTNFMSRLRSVATAPAFVTLRVLFTLPSPFAAERRGSTMVASWVQLTEDARLTV